MPQTPEYTVRLRTPHEHQREKDTPEPLTSAKASGKGMQPVWIAKLTSTPSMMQAIMEERYNTQQYARYARAEDIFS